MSPQLQLLLIFIGIPVALVGVPTVWYFIWKKSADRMDADIADILRRAKEAPVLDDDYPVSVRFHMYTGVLVLVRQTKVEMILPASAAAAVLKELMLLNLSNLKVYPGAIWVPLLTWFEYRSQCRSVRRQFAEQSQKVAGIAKDERKL